MKKVIISLLVAGAALAANAQDKALLETLVKKGMLTQQEAAQIAKESVEECTYDRDEYKKPKWLSYHISRFSSPSSSFSYAETFLTSIGVSSRLSEELCSRSLQW